MKDGKELWAQAVENNRRRNACKLHQFDAKESYRLGEYHICRNCSWKTRISDIGLYARGYQAAGGNPDLILLDIFKDTQP